MRNMICSTLMAWCLIVAPAIAGTTEEIQCNGKNLLPMIDHNAPAIAERMRAEAQTTPFNEGLIWKIESSKARPSYLFGTIHLSDPRLRQLKPAVQAAFDSSPTLALEITEILDPKKMVASAFTTLQYTTYTDGTSLDDKLTTVEKQAVSDRVREKLGLPWSVASRMKPWALMGALGLSACETARKLARQPVVDAYLGQMAKSQGKKIVALESMLGQLKAMDSLPETISIKGLVQSVSLGSRLDDLFETMIQLYLEEKTALVWSLMRRVSEDGFVPVENNAEYAAFHGQIVERRNQAMVEAAEAYLKQGGAFIAVGALHLPGERGMLNILAQKGYRISRVYQ
jgi:uncharacterized protein YbaP (TraB family)